MSRRERQRHRTMYARARRAAHEAWCVQYAQECRDGVWGEGSRQWQLMQDGIPSAPRKPLTVADIRAAWLEAAARTTGDWIIRTAPMEVVQSHENEDGSFTFIIERNIGARLDELAKESA